MFFQLGIELLDLAQLPLLRGIAGARICRILRQNRMYDGRQRTQHGNDTKCTHINRAENLLQHESVNQEGWARQTVMLLSGLCRTPTMKNSIAVRCVPA